jgi:hypothetical protein
MKKQKLCYIIEFNFDSFNTTLGKSGRLNLIVFMKTYNEEMKTEVSSSTEKLYL